MLRYRNFKVYKDAKDFHKLTVKLASQFSGGFNYLSNQIRRSSLSVVLNIAEGSAKGSDKDFNRYLKNSLGSMSETLAGFEMALEFQLISLSDFENIEAKAKSIIKQLGGFSKKLKG